MASPDKRFASTSSGMTHRLSHPTYFSNFVDERQQEYQYSAPGKYAAGTQCASTGRGATGTCPTLEAKKQSVETLNEQRSHAAPRMPALATPTGTTVRTIFDDKGDFLPFDDKGNQTYRPIHVLRNGVGSQHVDRLAQIGNLGADVTGGAHNTGETIMINNQFKLRNAVERSGALQIVTQGTCADNEQCHWSYGVLDRHMKEKQVRGKGGPPTGDASKKSASKANPFRFGRQDKGSSEMMYQTNMFQ
jgi:hypothetical protein